MSETIYAVVDLEMTSTRVSKGKIIQFGCAFVQSQQIIGTYATDINPGELIDKNIQELTGIDDERVADAPFFEEVADQIYDKLKDCVFVAHNAQSDFKFLNAKLAEINHKKLQVSVIDTVELSQIFYPTLDSYKLSDLTRHFHFYHEHPHQADSDAYVTAELFIQITNKILQIPSLTLDQIIKRGSMLTAQTRQYLKQLRKDHLVTVDDTKYNVISRILVAKEQEFHFDGERQLINFRPEQQELIQMLTADMDNYQTDFIIEAPTGIGKTLAYLQAFNEHVNKYQPLIISTSSIVLQEQIAKEVDKLNASLEVPLQAVVVKSTTYYLNLQQFVQTLNQASLGPTDRLWQMKVLVWLLETQTGDLSEIHARFEMPYIQKICHYGQLPKKRSKFLKVDFIYRLQQRIKKSQVLITNHALLLTEEYREQKILPKTKYLVIDEAHRFAEQCERFAEIRLTYADFKKKLKQLRRELNYQVEQKQVLSKMQMMQFEQILGQYEHILHNYELLFKERYFTDGKDNQVSPNFGAMSNEEQQLREHIKSLTTELNVQLQHCLLQLDSKQNYLQHLLNEVQLFIDYMYVFLTASNKSLYKEIQLFQEQIFYNLLDLYTKKAYKMNWYHKFQKHFYIGSTLLIGDCPDYFLLKLRLKEASVQKVGSDWHYDGKAYVLTDQKGNRKWYTVSELVNFLISLVKLPQSNKILCLMTSYESLHKTYHALSERLSGTGVLVLSQETRSVRARNLREFKKADQAILLGTDSMWEGIDLAKDSLNTVVMAKLPFTPPFSMFKEYKNQYLYKHRKKPFFDDELPHAMLKIRQGFGRLHRTPNDYGNLIILDKRFVRSTYSKKIQKALPTNFELCDMTMQECLNDLKKD